MPFLEPRARTVPFEVCSSIKESGSSWLRVIPFGTEPLRSAEKDSWPRLTPGEECRTVAVSPLSKFKTTEPEKLELPTNSSPLGKSAGNSVAEIHVYGMMRPGRKGMACCMSIPGGSLTLQSSLPSWYWSLLAEIEKDSIAPFMLFTVAVGFGCGIFVGETVGGIPAFILKYISNICYIIFLVHSCSKFCKLLFFLEIFTYIYNK